MFIVKFVCYIYNIDARKIMLQHLYKITVLYGEIFERVLYLWIKNYSIIRSRCDSIHDLLL
jgi:hypothetical protein